MWQKLVLVLLASLGTVAFAQAGGPLSLSELGPAAQKPLLQVVDTVSSLGPLAENPQTISLEDLVRFHGHPCDGLVVAAVGISFGLKTLFPDGIVDRTDLVIAVNRSACYGDVAAYLTGARHRYGSLTVDPELSDEWILHRRSTGQTIRVRLKEGIKPGELPKLEAELRKADCPPKLISKVEKIQKDYALHVLSAPVSEVFTLESLQHYPYPEGELRPDTAKAKCRH